MEIKEINRKLFSERFKKCRIENNYTQEKIAEELGAKRGTVASWEAGGYRIPELSKIYKAADVFDVSVDYLVGRTDDPSPMPIWKRDKKPTDIELEKFLNKTNIHFDGAPLTDEDKEDLLTYLKVKWERESKKKKKGGGK
ncbi:MAG: helix-turn-helix transcriptional regulator [Synergistaceae bacterium]|nr:helix-turn-helix transcriptional regulator [Synergistaceae bacterium]